jgi:pimeloyl-ACP methyl ester carboxylesterase
MGGRLPLLLLPGTLCDARLWSAVLPSLPEEVDCVCVEWGDETDVVAAARRMITSAPPRFAVAGMSMGGSVALEICALAGDRVGGLALVSSQPHGEPAERTLARAEWVEFARQNGVDALVRKYLWAEYVDPSRRDDAALFGTVLEMACDAGTDAYERQHLLLASRRDHAITLAMLEMPVLIAGGDSDALCAPALQAQMARSARQASRVEFSGCGHFSPLEAPAPLAAALCDWLAASSRGP